MLLNPSIVKKSQTQSPILSYLFPTEVYDEGDDEDFVVVDTDDDEPDEILVEHEWEEVDDDEDDGTQNEDELDSADSYGAYRSYSVPNRREFVLNT